MNTVGRWFFICFLIGVTCLLGFAYLIQSHLTDYFRQEKQQLMLAQASLVDSQIKDFMQQELQELNTWSGHPLVFEFAKKQVAQQQPKDLNDISISEMHYFAFLIENGVLADPNYLNSFLFDTQGQLLWSAEGMSDETLLAHPGFPSWIDKMQRGLSASLLVTPEGASKNEFSDDSVSIYFGTPLIENGQVIALLTISLNAKPRLLNVIKSARFSNESNLLLFDRYHQRITALEFDAVAESAIHRNLSGASDQSSRIFQLKDNMVARLWSDEQQVGIVISTPNASINQSLEKIQTGIAIIVFLAIAVMVALLLVITISKNKLRSKQLNIMRHRTRLLHVQDLAQVACVELTLHDQKMIWHSGFEFIYAFFPNETNSPTSLFNKLPSAVQTEYLDVLKRARIQRSKEEMELHYPFANGDEKYLSVQFFPQITDENKTILILISDITSQKQQHKAALEKEKEYRDLIIQSAHDGIVSVDLEGHVTLFNQACINMLGWEEKQLTSQPIQKLMYATENASRSRLMQISGTAKIWLACQDGRRLPVDCRVSPIMQNGESVGAVYLFRDISGQIEFENKLKASEQRFRRVIEGTSDATFDWDMVNNKLHWNTRFWEILGYEAEHAKLLSRQGEHNWQSAIHPDDVDKFIDAVQAHLIYGNLFDLEYRAIRVDKQEVWLRARGQAIKEHDKFVYLSGTISDVSKLKAAQQEKSALETQLRHAQKMEAIGQLTGGIAHDFNNILASILGYAELASDTIDMGKTERIPPYLEQIMQSGERARDLIKQMMVFSRKDTQTLKQINIQSLLDETEAIIRPLIPASIEIKFNNQADVLLKVDPVQFQQLLINLAVNARDAMQDKGKLEISCELTDDLGGSCSSCHEYFVTDYLKIAIEDNGKGISPEHLKKIFDPYFTSKGLGEGTGMGLSIVHGIVHQLGGHVRVESQLDQGTRFELFLPYEDSESSLQNQRECHEKPDTELKTDFRIFIIDDEVAIAKLIAQKLAIKGYRTEYSGNSLLALEHLLLSSGDYDLIITDQTMPELSGLELAQHLFKKQINIPVILCTGYSETVTESVALDAGIYAYLEKPIQFSHLESLIEAALLPEDRRESTK